ncbi:unnamed protein product [Pseudo-nitzschia multistriata]|uniref:Glycosyl transferase family 25 domain-containing protein n=1 Tax=Pseudo-nitzschia multistriata TaxID=183589 RepID=A0A448ZRY3_9STRA|nr:unnamed protein product [Pseudo-nitzschia multistriata]
MPYVPPHKRRLVGLPTPKQSASSGERTKTTALQRNYNKIDGSNTSDRLEDENCRLFCGTFSSIRCINLQDRTNDWERFLRQGRRIGPRFLNKLERFDAVNGGELVAALQSGDGDGDNTVAIVAPRERCVGTHCARIGMDILLEWDTTGNAQWDRHVQPGITKRLTPGEIGCALSHASLWRELATGKPNRHPEEGNELTGTATGSLLSTPLLPMLIFEDDAEFLASSPNAQQGKHYSDKSADRFLEAFRLARRQLPTDSWDVFYLGFSDRGERRDVLRSGAPQRREAGAGWQGAGEEDIVVELFRPTYGFHTHCYAITQAAAQRLLQNLPIVGPVDVWLADNEWFGLDVYCAVVANEGWKGTGSPLVGQNRRRKSSIVQSGRTKQRGSHWRTNSKQG